MSFPNKKVVGLSSNIGKGKPVRNLSILYVVKPLVFSKSFCSR